MSASLPPAAATKLPFAKYQGAGNDFVVVDGHHPALLHGSPPGSLPGSLTTLARTLCDRHFGIGADGLLVSLPPAAPGAASRMRMFNPDGSEAEMCGNGLRCFVRWLVERDLVATGSGAPGAGLAVETGAGVLAVEVAPDGQIAAQMGPPYLRPDEIPLTAAAASGQPPDGPVLSLILDVPSLAGLPGERFEATCVSMGNPHAVVFVPDVSAVPLEVVGPFLESHPAFPARTNVEFCQVLGPDRLRVRVWERGAGSTLACGTGACAAMVAARLRGYVLQRVAVELPGGELEVTWCGTAEPERRLPVVLRGPAEHVFDGEWSMSTTR